MDRIPSLALALLVAAAAVPGASADWLSFHGDERNTGYDADLELPETPALRWTNSTDGRVEASPVVATGRTGTLVILADWEGVVRALDAGDGTERWNTTFEDQVVGSPAIYGDRVFAADLTGTLRALDLDTGAELGTVEVGATRGAITVHEGKLFIGNEAGEVRAYAADTLTHDWTFDTGDVFETLKVDAITGARTCEDALPAREVRGAPVVYRGNVIFGSLNNFVFAVDEQGNPDRTTDIQWIYETGDAVFGSPAVDHARTRVVVGSYDEKVYSFPAAPSGQGGNECFGLKATPAWTFSVPSDIGASKVHSTPAIDGTNAYVGANNGRLYALDLKTGKKDWERDLGGPVTSSAVVASETVVAASESGRIEWMWASNGSRIARADADAPVRANPALHDGVILVDFLGNVAFYGPPKPTVPDLVAIDADWVDGTLTITVANHGDGEAGESTVRVLLDGAVLERWDLDALDAGGRTEFTLAAEAGVGIHTVTVEVDDLEDVEESDEANVATFEFTVESEEDVTSDPATSDTSDKPKRVPSPFALVGLVAALWIAMRRR